ncbi:MAG: rhodanese-like domain-containing protein [Casimicrobiaceae bacterium]
MAQLSAADLAAWRADPTRPAPLILDVREPWELAICRFEGATAIPLGQLPHRLGEIAASRPVVCVCHHGARSQHAAMLLNHVGRTEVFNLRGGVAAWAETVDPAMARY